MIIGSYTLQLYCDLKGCRNGKEGKVAFVEITGKTIAMCQKRVATQGWLMNRKDDLAYCPKCARASKTTIVKPINPKMAKPQIRKVAGIDLLSDQQAA